MNDLTELATNDAWRQVGIPPVSCQPPCTPFALLDDYSLSVDVID